MKERINKSFCLLKAKIFHQIEISFVKKKQKKKAKNKTLKGGWGCARLKWKNQKRKISMMMKMMKVIKMMRMMKRDENEGETERDVFGRK